jgi:hypothetical protein
MTDGKGKGPSAMAHAEPINQLRLSDPGTLRTSRLLIPSVFILIVGILVAQVVIPIGWALAGLYVVPVTLVALWTSSRKPFPVVWIATICTMLSTLVFFGSPFWDNKATLAMAFVFPLGSMWSIALLSVLRKWLERAAKARSKLQTLCPVCQQIHSDGATLSIQQYAQERPGSFVRISVCYQCAGREG